MKTCLLALLVLAAAAPVRADCDRDSDCKGGRVCVANHCVERKYCMRDKDCPGDQVCDRNSCIAPSGSSPAPAYTPYSSGGSREQAAALGAGMALQYTKNTWPTSIVDRPLVVAPGMTEVSLSVDKDISAEPAGVTAQHPMLGGMYARFGVSDRIHAGLDGLGLCFTDCDPIGTFRYLSVGAGYAVVATHDVNFVPALTAAVYKLASFDPATGGFATSNMFAIQPGFLFGWRVGSGLQIFASGGVAIGLTSREEAGAASDILALHFEPRLELFPQFSIGPYIGYSLSLKDTDVYFVPVGVNLVLVAARAVDIGGSFELGNIAPKSSTGQGAADSRNFSLFVTIRL